MSYKGSFLPHNIQKYKGNPTNIVYRSLLELRAMHYFDSHADVLSWSSEETVIPYVDPVRDGVKSTKRHRYFVDFQVTCKTKSGEVVTYLVEVKPEAQTRPPKPGKKKTRRYLNEVATYATNMAKWEAARKACEKRDWKFIIITEKQLTY